MILLAIAAVGALLSGALALWRQPQVPRYWPLLAVAMLPQAANLIGMQLPWMFFGAIAIVCVWCLYNAAIPGTLIVALGLGCNLLVMAFHGGAMPVRADVLASLWYAAEPGTLIAGSKDIVILESALWLLSDWIIVPLGATPIIISIGDVLIVIGVLWWLLFSYRPAKEGLNAHTFNHSDLDRVAHTPTPRPE